MKNVLVTTNPQEGKGWDQGPQLDQRSPTTGGSVCCDNTSCLGRELYRNNMTEYPGGVMDGLHRRDYYFLEISRKDNKRVMLEPITLLCDPSYHTADCLVL